MHFVRLICALLLIACAYASPISQVSSTTTTTSEGLIKIESTTKISKETTVKSNGLTTVWPSLKSVVQPTKAATVRIRPTTTTNSTVISKTDALYQMANNLLQKEKNWLQTEKWLIDNVYRLRNELGDIKRELSDQKKLNTLLNSQKSAQLQFVSASDPVKNANFVQDLTALRGDHSLISQQQQQIVQATKDGQQQLHMQSDLLKQLITMVKEQFKSVASISQAMVSLQQINDSTNGNTNQLISKLMYDLSALSTTSSAETEKLLTKDRTTSSSKQPRSISPRILQFLKTETQFEGRTENKLGQLTDELHGLHSMTMNLSKDLADLQKQVIKK